MNCPVCNVPLVMSDRHNVEIDYCPQCRGVWLDRGELDKIIEKSAAPASYQEAPRPAGPERYGEQERSPYSKDPHKRHKKESWLGDLFDF